MRKTICTTLLLLFIPPYFALANDPAPAEEPEATMAEVVVTATRSEVEINKIPAKIEVIDSQTIELTSGNTLTEQLKKNSSINVIEYPGNTAGIGIRGFRPEFSGITKHSLILINGRPAGVTNLGTIQTNNIERIEVLKGPASSLYGAEAMGGVINVITKKNTDELVGNIEIGFGSFSTNSQSAAIGGGLGDVFKDSFASKFNFDLSVSRLEQADDFKMGNGETRANTSFSTETANLRLGADITEDWQFDINSDIYRGRDIETPGDIFDGNLKSGRKDIDHYGFDVNLTGKLGHNNILSITAYKANETSENYNNYSGWFVPVQVEPYRSYDDEIDWLGLQIKNEYNWSKHRFIVGLDYQDIDSFSRNYSLDGKRTNPYSPDEGRQNIAGYLESIWSFLEEKLTATAGGRYDTFEVETKPTPFKTDFTPNTEDFSTFSPRAGINYLFDQGIRLHTTIGKAFVPPTAGQLAGYSEQLLGSVTMISKGNSNLDPESSITYDAGIGYDQPSWGLSADITYFHTDVDDKISNITIGNVQTYQNSLSAEMEGIETTLSFDLGAPFEWDRTVSFYVNATYMLKAEEEQAPGVVKDIYNVADYSLNYGIFYDDGLINSKLHFRKQGTMKDTDWNSPGYPEIEYPSFTVVDLVIGAYFYDHHKLSLNIDNLFDEDYYEKEGFPKPGQSFLVSYSYEF